MVNTVLSSTNVLTEHGPILAIGMNAAPFNWAKRQLVRSTMLIHPAVLDQRIIFRFVVGSMLIRKKSKAITASKTSQADWGEGVARLHAEIKAFADIAQLEAIDGPGVAMECPAAEKTILWMQYALKHWPHARFYAKTEDDTYLHFGALEADLLRLSDAPPLPNVLYGLMGICSMPTAARAARSPAGHKACFLGSLERVGWLLGAHRSVIQWRQGGNTRNGGKRERCAPGSTEPAPFPTGPLMVMGADLARTVFRECDYLTAFNVEGRAANRRTLCRGRDKAHSWASLVGDCAIGHWVSRCARGLNVTVAHMTYTKAHHYAINAGGQGWVSPSNTSVAIHWLKRHTGPSGPSHTEGGEWAHTHEATVGAARHADFPPLLWRYAPSDVVHSGRVLQEALNIPVHEWYARSCGVWRETLSAHIRRLRERVAQLNDSAQQHRSAGTPSSWPFYGCHTSRGYPMPIWPAAGLPHAS